MYQYQPASLIGLVALIATAGAGRGQVPTAHADPVVITEAEGAEEPVPYSRVHALFAKRCTWCHGGPKPTRGLRLDEHAHALTGSESGPVIVPGDPDASELIRRVRGDSSPRMPFDGPPYLDAEEIALLERWVSAGALGPPSSPALAAGLEEETTAQVTPPEAQAPLPPDRPILFDQVRPVLMRRCVHCHTTDGMRGPPPEGLILAHWRTVLAGGERVVVVPGQPIASLLYRHVRGLESPRMPFDGPPFLDQESIDLLRRWIEDGARDHNGQPSPMPTGGFVKLRGRLTDRWAIDGMPFDIAPGARVRDAVVDGRIEIRGTVQANGRILASRVRGR